jgi:endoglucanase
MASASWVSPAAASSAGALALSRPPQTGNAQALRNQALAAWADYRSRFVSASGRVADTGNHDISHSEGQGVSMLMAALLDDAPTFDRMWAWTQRTLLREDALLAWRYESGRGVTDRNNASDGELYVLWALHQAGLRRAERALLAQGARIARALRETCVVEVPPHGTMLLPGQHGFVFEREGAPRDVVVNPAYWVFPALHSAQELDPSPAWGQLRESGLRLLAQARFGRHELPADWLRLTQPPTPWAERPARFGWEAIRVPLFLYWAGELRHPALARFARFAASPGFPAWVGFDDMSRSAYAAPAGFEAVAQLARQAAFGQPPTGVSVDSDYFSSSLTLLALLARMQRAAPRGAWGA